MSAAVITGVCLGSSAALGVIAELPDDSKTVQWLFKSQKKAAIVSTVLSMSIGIFCGPVSGVIAELITYPACWIKVKKVKRYMNKHKEYQMPDIKLSSAKYTISNNSNTHLIKTCFAN